MGNFYSSGNSRIHCQVIAFFTLNLTFRLRLPSSLSTEEKMKRVEQLLADLELTHTANTQVGDEMRRGISGGEKKRVSIGVEMITDPNILFLVTLPINTITILG
jgi:ABC-type multidrug transport system ATPase subunit